jgi:deazaflavin-dependent oxidoreductase (nitroreductase family)
MPLEGEYEPSSQAWVREQVERYEATGGREAGTLRDTGLPVVIFSTRGAKSGKVRKQPLMRVEHGGAYAMVGSQGGAPTDPAWVANLRAHPDQVTVQDGPEPWDGVAREVHGEERAQWWERAVVAYPPYADYQQKTERVIPVFVVERRPDGVGERRNIGG